MSNIFTFYKKLTKSQQRKLYCLYYTCQLTPDTIHNLSSVKIIPEIVKIALILGYKYNFSSAPNYGAIKRSLSEGARKISWYVFFKCKDSDRAFSQRARITHKIKKVVHPSKPKCPIDHILFNDNFLAKSVEKTKQSEIRHNNLHDIIINELKRFLRENSLIIKPSDKNAGLCIMDEASYEQEILRQLHDDNTYRPSVLTEFEFKMNDFKDKARHLSNFLDKSFKLKSIIPVNYHAAKFYVLPKVHKKFDNFPVGRPICNTRSTINKGVSMILDAILQPLSMYVPNLLIDSTHLIYLLSKVSLDTNRKYMLVTADINAMYLELPIHCCKENVVKFFEEVTDKCLPFDITSRNLKILLDLCLDYSFIDFNNELFFQHKGIQMGNSASVSIANITAYMLLRSIWVPEVVFKTRFIDDIFLILDVTDIENPETLIENIFTHPFLKFSHEYSSNKVNFLDLSIMLDEKNHISTSLYKKPMNKHEFLHFSSNHPKHIMKSLPYSCGLRVIRACSNDDIKFKELDTLFNRFAKRGYPKTLLNDTFHKLCGIDRTKLILPKSDLLCNYLRIHGQEIAHNVNVESDKVAENSVFVVLPFYNNIRNIGKLVNDVFVKELNQCVVQVFKECLVDLNVQVAFSVNNSLATLLSVNT